jgi:hypothetical protein
VIKTSPPALIDVVSTYVEGRGFEMAKPNNVALVFGASGISGWAVTKCALSYPTPTTFARVIGLTNRPLPLEKSGLPQNSRLELYSGVNLRASLDEVLAKLQETVPNLEDVTHVYYLGE